MAGFLTAFGLKGQFKTVHTWSGARGRDAHRACHDRELSSAQLVTESRASSARAMQSVSNSQQERQRKRTLPSRSAAQKSAYSSLGQLG